MPELDRVAADLQPSGVRFLAVSIDHDEKKVKQVVSRLRLKMPVALSETEALAPFGTSRIPAIAFVTRDGVIAAVATGSHKAEFVRSQVRELLTN